MSDSSKDTIQKELDALARVFAANAKLPPVGSSYFLATSGVRLPYYLNLTTNLLIPSVSRLAAAHCKRMLHEMIQHVRESSLIASSRDIYCIGPETAGGILVSQVCQAWSESDEEETPNMNFIYMRKKRKLTGTLQHIEGAPFITGRSSRSSPALGVWLDDVVSTGKSLLDGVKLLKEDYNINIVAALFLVDRSSDRKKSFKMKGVSIRSLMDEDAIKEHLERREGSEGKEGREGSADEEGAKIPSMAVDNVDDALRRLPLLALLTLLLTLPSFTSLSTLFWRD